MTAARTAPAPWPRRRAGRTRVAGAALAAAIAAAFACGPGDALAELRVGADGDAYYRVQPGDTLVDIARRWTESPERWRDLQRLNRVSRPTRLAPGSELRIRVEWVRGEPATLVVREAGGQVSIDGVAATPGAVGREGTRIETGPDGVAVLVLGDGTVLTIPPASAVRIERLRQYLGPGAVDAEMLIERGSIDTASPPARPRPLRVRTPAATAAVRGTEFRVRARPRDAAVEVLAGAVEAGSRGGSATLAGGQGAIASPDGPPRVEALLPAPALEALPARVTQVAARLPFDAVPGAAGYRVQVALDPGFTRLLAEASSAGPEVAFVSRADGPLHVRVRGVAASGLEGRESRTVVEVAARPEPPLPMRPPERGVVFGDEVVLAWAQPEGVDAFRVQVAADPSFAQPVHDAAGPGAARTVALPPAAGPGTTWHWRIASIAGRGADARQGPFSAPRSFDQRPVGGAPSGQVDDDRLELAWPALPGHRYELELATDPGFGAPMLRRGLTEPRTVIEGLAPGVYHVRTRSIDPQGHASPFGPPQRFEVRSLLRSGAGTPVGTGSGAPVELQDRR